MKVYQLIETIESGFSVHGKSHGLFSKRETAEKLAKRMYPKKELRDYHITIKEIKVN